MHRPLPCQAERLVIGQLGTGVLTAREFVSIMAIGHLPGGQAEVLFNPQSASADAERQAFSPKEWHGIYSSSGGEGVLHLRPMPRSKTTLRSPAPRVFPMYFLVRCDYSQHPNTSSHASCLDHTSSLVEFGTCGWDLSRHGQNELISCVLDSTSEHGDAAVDGLGVMLRRVLSEVNLTASDLRDEYSRFVQNWFPILSPEQLLNYARNPWMTPSSSLLWLAIVLVTTGPCGHVEHLRRKRLYITAKTVSTAIEAQKAPGVIHIQVHALIALYECGQGMVQQAHLTLSSAITRANLIDVEKQVGASLHWRVSLIILDRMIVLSAANDTIPLLCPASTALSRGLEAQIDPLSREEISLLDNCSQKLHVMAKVVLLAGRVLEFVDNARMGNVDEDGYCSIEEKITSMVKSLIYENRSYSWSFCDPTTMTLCCVLILHSERVRITNATQDSKDFLALQASWRMVWDTCRISLEANANSDISKLSFVSMCCTLRAVSDILHDPLTGLRHEIQRLLPVIRRFSRRWAIGGVFLSRIEATMRLEKQL
ncbi:hypothetical protein ACJZ2D_015422 [Fusarium nematophilum]